MLSPQMKVKDIVLEHPETAQVFQEQQIDYCCRGNVTVDEACQRRGTAAADLWRALEAAIAARRSAHDAALDDDVRLLDTPHLVARVVDRHHAYLRRTLPFLVPLSAKVARVHGAAHPELVDLARVVDELAATLLAHLDDEEARLFPALLNVDARRRADDGRAALDGDLELQLTEMLEEHLQVGDALVEMRALAGDYVIPAAACNSWRTLLRELEAVEGDTLRHVHLENHVLAPRFTRDTAQA